MASPNNLERACVDFMLTLIIKQLFNNYGPGEANAHIIPEILQQLSNGNDTLNLGNIKPVRDYVHTRDTAQVMMKLITTDLLEVFNPLNICTGEGHSIENLIEIIKELLNRDITVEKDPKRFREVDKMVQMGSFSNLQKISGWEPQLQIEEGLKDLLDFEGFLIKSLHTGHSS